MADLTFLTRHPLVRRMLLPAIFLLGFLLFVVVTFPYDTLARRLEIEAQREGAELTIGRLGPSGLLGLRARDVKLRLPAAPGSDALPELHFERADLSPDLFSFLSRKTGFGFRLNGYGGTARGHAALSNDPKLPGLLSFHLDAADLDLHALPLKELSGLETSGKLTLKVDLPALQPAELASGSMTLSLKGGGVTGGSLQGFPIPKVSLGDLEGNVVVEKGMAKVEKAAARGGDVDADVDGTVKLRPLLSLSQADLHVRFHLSDKWLNENSMIKGAIGLIQNARQGDGSYVFSFSGPLSRMTPRPGR
jgi:type II secretion system protein N